MRPHGAADPRDDLRRRIDLHDVPLIRRHVGASQMFRPARVRFRLSSAQPVGQVDDEGPDQVFSARAIREEGSALDLVDDYFGSEKRDLVLAVTPPDGPAFHHADRYKIARRLGGLRATNKRWRPLPGLALPVLVSADRQKVEIGWDAFVAEGGIDRGEALTNQHRSQQGAAELGKMLVENPDKAAKQREWALAHFPNQAIEVTTGVRPAAEFARSISSLVQGDAELVPLAVIT